MTAATSPLTAGKTQYNPPCISEPQTPVPPSRDSYIHPHIGKISFFLWFYSDYYVLYIDPEYRYLLVGSSSDKYLWIMSREKSLAKETLDQLLDKLRVRGYDTDKLLFVAQD